MVNLLRASLRKCGFAADSSTGTWRKQADSCGRRFPHNLPRLTQLGDQADSGVEGGTAFSILGFENVTF